MKPALRIFSLLMILAFAGVLVAGCSDTADTSDTQSSSVAAVATTETMTVKYSAGDIVKNPKSTGTSGLLILGYDAATDTYERAYIYPNTDGSWGYRLDTKTEKISRPTIENLYTEKAGSVEVSDIPIGKPTTATVTATTAATTVVTTATATETTASAAAPKITDMEPGKGATGTTVSITSLEGRNFVSGATVALKKSGETSIPATSVSVTSSELITCSIVIPSTAVTGFWDVVITNPDGQSYSWANGFIVTQGSTTATTTTTSTTGSSSSTIVTLYSPSPSVIYLGVTINSQEIDVMGTNLSAVTNLKLVSSSNTMTSTTYYASSNQEARAFFTIPSGSEGTYAIQAVDSSGNILGSMANALSIE